MTETKQHDLSLFGDAHVAKYRETGGEVGYYWNGARILLLTTTGRKSGDKRTTPLIYVPDGDNFVLVASKGGAPQHPSWYLNLDADRHVQVQVKDKIYDVVARDAESPERERLWDKAAQEWPDYNDYAQKTDRHIPVVVLEPVKG